MLPRPIIPGSTYLITRRCTQRQFWLRPCALTNQIVRYCVAFASSRYGVQVHALCVLSNHWHCVVTDPKANLPKFLQWVHEYVAKCINASYGRWENMWSSEQTSVVRLVDDDDVIDKLVYTLANPVSSGLVAHGDRWPGVRSQAGQLVGTNEEVARPPIFFRKNGPMPESCTLTITRPAICKELSDDALARRVSELVTVREAAIRDDHARRGVGQPTYGCGASEHVTTGCGQE
jgi:putative transposase